MIKSKKLVSLFISAAMLITMLSFFTMAACAEETSPQYTTHAWYTFEEGTLPGGVTSNTTGTSAVDLTIDGKYGKAVKVTKRADKLGSTLYPYLKVNLAEPIAIANGTTVEVEFDYYINIYDDYFYIFLCDSTSDEYDAAGNAYIRVKTTGEAKLYHNANSSDTNAITMSANVPANVNSWHRIKLVFDGSVVDDTKGWILKGAYFDGSAQKSSYWGNTFFTVDFRVLGFRNKMIKDHQVGDFGVDNVSITSYATASTSPVPDRHKFMNRVLTHTDKVGTTAYQSALDLFERSYITKDEIGEALYVLEADSNLYEITDIAKSNNKVHFTTTDSTGGKPLLIVGAYDRKTDELLAVNYIKLSGFKTNGSENGVTYDLGELPETGVVIKAFIFSSLDSLVPLAVSRTE